MIHLHVLDVRGVEKLQFSDLTILRTLVMIEHKVNPLVEIIDKFEKNHE